MSDATVLTEVDAPRGRALAPLAKFRWFSEYLRSGVCLQRASQDMETGEIVWNDVPWVVGNHDGKQLEFARYEAPGIR